MRTHTQRPPKWTNDVPARTTTWTIPWCDTKGTGAVRWNNAAHAAISELLVGLQCTKREDARHWIARASKHLANADRLIQRPGARLPKRAK